MQIYFHSRLCSYLSRVPILVEGTVYENVAVCSRLILKTENVTHPNIELIMIIVLELNRETKIHTL